MSSWKIEQILCRKIPIYYKFIDSHSNAWSDALHSRMDFSIKTLTYIVKEFKNISTVNQSRNTSISKNMKELPSFDFENFYLTTNKIFVNIRRPRRTNLMLCTRAIPQCFIFIVFTVGDVVANGHSWYTYSIGTSELVIETS